MEIWGKGSGGGSRLLGEGCGSLMMYYSWILSSFLFLLPGITWWEQCVLDAPAAVARNSELKEIPLPWTASVRDFGQTDTKVTSAIPTRRVVLWNGVTIDNVHFSERFVAFLGRVAHCGQVHVSEGGHGHILVITAKTRWRFWLMIVTEKACKKMKEFFYDQKGLMQKMAIRKAMVLCLPSPAW